MQLFSDRDPRFTSALWKELVDVMGGTQCMSTAFYPQTDGASEKTNE